MICWMWFVCGHTELASGPTWEHACMGVSLAAGLLKETNRLGRTEKKERDNCKEDKQLSNVSVDPLFRKIKV